MSRKGQRLLRLRQLASGAKETPMEAGNRERREAWSEGKDWGSVILDAIHRGIGLDVAALVKAKGGVNAQDVIDAFDVLRAERDDAQGAVAALAEELAIRTDELHAAQAADSARKWELPTVRKGLAKAIRNAWHDPTHPGHEVPDERDYACADAALSYLPAPSREPSEELRALRVELQRAEADRDTLLHKTEPEPHALHYDECPYKPFADLPDWEIPELAPDCTCSQAHKATYWKARWMLANGYRKLADSRVAALVEALEQWQQRRCDGQPCFCTVEPPPTLLLPRGGHQDYCDIARVALAAAREPGAER